MSEPKSGASIDADSSSKTFFAEVEPGRKGEILDAALSVFAENGYDNGSMREIAQHVGFTEPALYRHFPGKEALFLALIRVGAGRMRAELFALIDALEPEADVARDCSGGRPKCRVPRCLPLGHREAGDGSPVREGRRTGCCLRSA
jgi:AcrR family transcriptional regulator